MLGNQVALPVEARLAVLGMEFAEAISDRHVRANDQHRVGEATVAPVVDLVQDAPRRQHPHHGGLPTASRHLAGIAPERLEALLLALVARFVERDLDSLAKVGASLVEKNDRLSRFKLCEEQSMLAAFATPIVEQVERRPSDSWIALATPLLDALANQIDELEFLPSSPRGMFIIARRCFRIAIEVPRWSASRSSLRRCAFFDIPVLRRLLVRRVEYRLGYFVVRHSPVPHHSLGIATASDPISWCS